MASSALDLHECSCPHLSRQTRHGFTIREAYENSVVSAIRGFLSPRDSQVQSELNVAVIGSGELLQEFYWLNKLFNGAHPNKTNLHLVDAIYQSNIKAVEDLREAFINCKNKLSITPYSSCEDLIATEKAHNLIIGMDTECATSSAATYQWQALYKGDLDKVLLVRWNCTGGHFFEVYSRKGSDPKLNTAIYNYTFDQGVCSVSDDTLQAITKRIREAGAIG